MISNTLSMGPYSSYHWL